MNQLIQLIPIGQLAAGLLRDGNFRRQTGHKCIGLRSFSSWWLLPFIWQK
jgi:hypothetical protein